MAPTLAEAIEVARGKAYVILDGTLLRIDRVGMTGGRDRPYDSGKHKCHGVNVQVIADPAGRLVWASPTLAGARHDIGAAREHDIIDAIADAGVRVVALREATLCLRTKWPRTSSKGSKSRVADPCVVNGGRFVRPEFGGGSSWVFEGPCASPPSPWLSADLDAVAHHPVVRVCAGARAYSTCRAHSSTWRRSACRCSAGARLVPGVLHSLEPAPVPHRVETADEVAATFGGRSRTDTCVLRAVPIPVADELDPAQLDAVLTGALDDTGAAGIVGAAVTPFVLARIADVTAGRSIPAKTSPSPSTTPSSPPKSPAPSAGLNRSQGQMWP